VSVRLSITDAEALANAALVRLGFDAEEAAIATRHLIDAELRGLGYAGFGRLVSIAEQIKKRGLSRQPMSIVKETPVSARLDGGDQLGLIVAQRATEIAIAKAKTSGIAIVGASNTWYTGMLSYYAEQPASRDMVTMVASNATARVAPYGGNERRMGANPICFGFPSADEPVVWDIGTSAVGHAQVMLARRLDQPLEEDVAFDTDGSPTTDPAAALAGAFAAWGGHRGSGLGIVVQLLGMLVGSPMLPGELRDFGFLIVAVQPGLLTPLDEFKKSVAEYSGVIRNTRPLDPVQPLRMPFDRSRAARTARIESGVIDVPDAIYSAIAGIAAGH
jgi:delta1-piperideine-2-carboxylate reductase